MTHDQFNLAELLFRADDGDLTLEEQKTLDEWLDASPGNRDLQALLDDIEWVRREWPIFTRVDPALSWPQIEDQLADADLRHKKNTYTEKMPTGLASPGVIKKEKRIRTVRGLLLGTTAAVLIFLGVRIFFPPNQQEQKIAASLRSITPAREGATLRVAGGPVLDLTTVTPGLAEKLGCLNIIRTDSDHILLSRLHGCSLAQPALMEDTLITTRGHWFRVTLTDGTKVRLNPASVLRFPTEFAATQRDVRLEGEGYFEVAPDVGLGRVSKPFVVQVPVHRSNGPEGLKITSTGTRFMIRAYSGETDIRASLDEGAIRVETKDMALALQPGEAAVLDRSGILRKTRAQPVDTAAWNKGRFAFKEQPLEHILQDLGRWYNVTILYTGDKPGMDYSLGGQRQDSLTALLNELKEMGAIQYTINSDTVRAR